MAELDMLRQRFSPGVEDIVRGESEALSTVEKCRVDEHAVASAYRETSMEQLREAREAIQEFVRTRYKGASISERVQDKMPGGGADWRVTSHNRYVEVNCKVGDRPFSFKCFYDDKKGVSYRYDPVGRCGPYECPYDTEEVLDVAIGRGMGVGLGLGTVAGAVVAGTSAGAVAQMGSVGAVAVGGLFGAISGAFGGLILPIAIGAVGAVALPVGYLAYRGIRPLYRYANMHKGDVVGIPDASLSEELRHDVMLATLELPDVLSRGYNQHKAKIDEAARGRMLLAEKKLKELQQYTAI